MPARPSTTFAPLALSWIAMIAFAGLSIMSFRQEVATQSNEPRLIPVRPLALYESEAMHLLMELGDYLRTDEASRSGDRLVRRYDILWSRLEHLTTGTVQTTLEGYRDSQLTLETAWTIVRNYQPEIDDLAAATDDRLREFEHRLSASLPDIHRLSMAGFNDILIAREGRRNRLIAAYKTTLFWGLGALLSGLVMCAVFFVRNRSLNRLRRSLEGLLQERTAETERALKQLRAAIDNLPEAFLVTDRSFRLKLYNQAFVDLYGLEPGEVREGISVEELDELASVVDLKLNGDNKTDATIDYAREICSLRDTFRFERYFANGRIADVRGTAVDGIGWVGTMTDITRRKKFENKLLAAQEQAKHAASAKSSFLANMSHEIRTPMNTILGFANLLHKDTTLTKEQSGKLSTIIKSGEHLLAIINSVLQMSKIEANKVVACPENFDLHALLEDVVTMFQANVRTKPLGLDLEMDANLQRYIKSDSNMLRQILINLLGNAVKFTDKGRVELRAWSEPEGQGVQRLVMTISDTGIGLAEDEIGEVFSPFFQSGRHSNRDGTGLGLTISREFARLLGGDIAVDSRCGQGSTFRVEAVVEDGCMPIDRLYRQSPENPAPAGERRSPKILIADDTADHRNYLMQLLAPLGFALVEAANGTAALAAIRQFAPDLLLLDVRMPDVDGIEVLRRIRRMPKGNDTIVICVTGYAFEEEHKKIMAAGATAVLSKPLKEEELLRTIKCCFRAEQISCDRSEREVETVYTLESARHDAGRLPADLLFDLRQAAGALNEHEFERALTRLLPENQNLHDFLSGLKDQYEWEEMSGILT